MFKGRRPTRDSFKPPLKRPASDCLNESSTYKNPNLSIESGISSIDGQKKSEIIGENLKSRIERLREKNKQLDEEISDLRKQGFDESQSKLFIEKLHKYNSIKDLGQSLLGQLAIRKGVTTKALYPKFDLELDD